MGTNDATRKAPLNTSVTTEDATSALVPCVSKCWDGSKGAHHGFVVRWALKTESVCAEVPRMAMLKMTTRPVMAAWAVWKGVGLTFMVVDDLVVVLVV